MIDLNETLEAITVSPEMLQTTAKSFIHSRPPSYVVWTTGMVCVTLINLCAVVGIAVMKYLTKDTYNRVITLFVGLGVGSLSGSSFYHLLPQAYPQLVDEVDENGRPTHNYLTMAHWSLCGVYMFFLVDKLIKIFLERRKKNRGHRCVHEENTTPRTDTHILLNGHTDAADRREIEMMKLENNADKAMVDQGHAVCVHDHSVSYTPGESPIAAVAWMIIFGDGFHNFIDGISIGASFSESLHSGFSISLAVLCEEFPHELGDVAILVASGMTLRQAFLYNLLSAFTCYAGFALGVMIGEMGSDVTKYAFALAGGMFLYISLGCMMPEMRKVMEEALNVSFWRGLSVLLLQCFGLFTGITLMYVMARYGDEISI